MAIFAQITTSALNRGTPAKSYNLATAIWCEIGCRIQVSIGDLRFNFNSEN